MIKVTESQRAEKKNFFFKVIDHCSVHLLCLDLIEVGMLIQYLQASSLELEPLQPQPPSTVNSKGVVIGK